MDFKQAMKFISFINNKNFQISKSQHIVVFGMMMQKKERNKAECFYLFPSL